MKSDLKADYQRLRQLSCTQLWTQEVPRFDEASPTGRMNAVSVVRAVGVVFSESGNTEQKAQARRWLRGLLHDPQEKIRRYAIAALPKLGAAGDEETELLDLLHQSASEREKEHLGQALQKIGGAATRDASASDSRTRQKAQANLARAEHPGRVRLEGTAPSAPGLEIHLHCRTGLEGILEDETFVLQPKFRLVRTAPGLVVLQPETAFTLAEIFNLRCFSRAAFHLGTVSREDDLPQLIAADRTRQLLEAFTEGPLRYRLDFPDRGHQRGLVRTLTDRVFTLCPALLNDARAALWQIDVHDRNRQLSVELAPRLRPDPRFAYRGRDVPAASHPPLAAAMARLAGSMRDETVWDPFCGSGVELMECALRGGVRRVIGTDLSAEAIAAARANFAAATVTASTFIRGDFRDAAPLGPTLIVTNPPMGRRVPVADLPGLIADLFAVAEKILPPGGRLILANPVSVSPITRRLHREFRQEVDLGGFTAFLEKYIRPHS